MGIATGLMAAAGSIAAPLASLVAGGLSDVYGPRAIFAVMAVMTLVAIALLPGVRPPIEYSSEPSTDPSPLPLGED
jgi:MFS family permease